MLLSSSKISTVMEKTDEAHDSLFLSNVEPRLVYWRSGILNDLGCGAALWICGGALGTIELALQEGSHNALLRDWQDLVGGPIQQSSSAVLIGSIAFCTVGYAAACMYAYSRAPSLVAFAATVCIALVFIEGFWNGLHVTPVERLAVVMPMAVNVGLTCAMHCQRGSRPRSAVLIDCNAV
ncbi:hypothetical protein K491DRAFT_694003 [Lophiostoma macrostomum CBS 122681]|uniref:Uncharacterized protein n=1 Tax=Lophiostoma macrostomum CBS 122681 TaxID=1314788 RepID=A0A6A6T5Y3_9PLEO|nr:hypothetical protein K491DRAFT_694003 [Lophiostoma macrostomum CBS 122681]